MPPAILSLFDPGALAIVVAGTVIATAARCGWRDFAAALKAAAGLMRGGFKREANRKALALAVSAIQRDGPRRADPLLPPDRALALMLETYLRRGVMEPLAHVRRAERSLDEARRMNTAQVFIWAGELAPVFGLIGTLFGLTQLAAPAGAGAAATIMTAVSTAVLTSLYGALIAHLVCYPLASAIERCGLAEEQEREALADWFMAQVRGNEVAAQAYRAHLREVS
jgi:chemotaxis protein MotA